MIRNAWILGLALVAATWQAGCRTVPPAETPISAEAPTPVESPVETWAAIRTGQEARLERLANLTARGSVLIDVVETSGERTTERADALATSPDRARSACPRPGRPSMTAWNGSRWWVMDESGTRSCWCTSSRRRIPPVSSPRRCCSRWPVSWSFQRRRDGPRQDRRRPSIHDSGTGPDGRAGTAHLEITVSTPADGPVDIVRRAPGEPVVRSTLTRFEPVEGRGRAPGDWASMPGRIEIAREGDRIVVTLDRPLADGEMSPRLFDLDAQIERSRPSVVRGLP